MIHYPHFADEGTEARGGGVIYPVLGTPLTKSSFLQELHRTEFRHGRDARSGGADTAALPPECGPNAQGAAEA